jgi:hypothetical protein
MATNPTPVPAPPVAPEPPKSSFFKEPAKWLQVLIIPLTTLIIGQYASSWQERESARRTYAEMMNSREQAESSLRKDMFQSTIVPFLAGKSDNIEASVLRLELLAGNFHDSLDLSPLFRDVYRTLSARRKAVPGPETEELIQRLTTTSQEAVRREIDAIREASTVRTGTVDFEALKQGPVTLFGEQPLTLPGNAGPKRTFRVEVLNYDKLEGDVLARLSVWDASTPPKMELQTKAFHIGPFDFPLMDNTRLAGGDRVALVLDGAVEDDIGQVTLVYFPGSRASMRDKQYYEDMAAELLRIEKRKKQDTQGQQ